MSLKKILTVVGGGIMAGALLYARAKQIFQPRQINRQEELEQQRQTEIALQNTWGAIMQDNPEQLMEAVIPTVRVLVFTYLGSSNVPPSRPASNEPVFSSQRNDQRNHSSSPSESFKAQLERIDFNLDNIPPEFCDPITFELMEDPVIGVTQINVRGRVQNTEHIYDRSTFSQLRGTCPDNRQPFIEMKDAAALKENIAKFVNEQVQAHHLANEGAPSIAVRASA